MEYSAAFVRQGWNTRPGPAGRKAAGRTFHDECMRESGDPVGRNRASGGTSFLSPDAGALARAEPSLVSRIWATSSGVSASRRRRNKWGVSQHPADRRHGVQKAFGSCRWPKHQKDKIDRLGISSVEVDRTTESRKKHDRGNNTWEFCMGKCDTLAESRRTEFLAGLQSVENFLLGTPETACSLCRQNLEQVPFVPHARVEHDVSG